MNYSELCTFRSLYEKRQTVKAHTEARLTALLTSKTRYAAEGKAKEFYETKAHLTEQLALIDHDLQHYEAVLRAEELLGV